MNEDERKLVLNLSIDIYLSGFLDIPTSVQDNSNLDTSVLRTTPTDLSAAYPISLSIRSEYSQIGIEVIRILINALIEYYLVGVSEQGALDDGDGVGQDNISVEDIINRLQSTCPTLFGNEDALCAKASECLTQVGWICNLNLLEYEFYFI